MENLNTLKERLIFEAREKYGEIFPCGIKTNLSDCFILYEPIGKIVFLFNTALDKSTRALSADTEEGLI